MCGDLRLHRTAALACESHVPRASAPELEQPPAPGDTCSADSDCTEQPYGYCTVHANSFPGGDHKTCRYGCATDGDCGAGFICKCGGIVGECVPASCRTDEDCGDG